MQFYQINLIYFVISMWILNCYKYNIFILFKMKNLLKFIWNKAFIESSEHLLKLLEFIKNTKLDDEIKDLMEEYKLKIFFEGWNILMSIMKVGFIIPLIVIIFKFGFGHPLVARSAFVWTTFLVVTIILSILLEKYKIIRDNAFVSLMIVFGVLCVNGNLTRSYYSIYEPWFVYCYFSQFWSLMMWINWRKVVLAHVLVMTYSWIRVAYQYTNVEFILYPSVISGTMYFSFTSLMIAKHIKEMLYLIKENKQLIHTIKTILQTFPEGVIIRSLDEVTKKTITKFANDVFQNTITKLLDESSNSHNDTEVNIWVKNDGNSTEEQITSFEDFVNQQEDQVTMQANLNKISEQIIEIRHKVQHINDEGNSCDEEFKVESVYNVKSVGVAWENNKLSFMHVFIDMTNVQNLEKIKATNKCQQLMFSSVSHEFRTPLNAFVNSTQIVEYAFDNVKQKLKLYPEIETQVEQWYAKVDKMLTISKISSKQLLNLVEDILDLARFDAGRFELNIGTFKLADVLREIEYIFSFQWQEKQLTFNIKCSRRLRERVFRSDEKRIKQILINLISNSLKFTQRGGISLRIGSRQKSGQDFLKFEVEDTGVGIKREDVSKLFKMFGMLENKHTHFHKI